MMRKNLNTCKAETEGRCSFDCLDCCYDSKEMKKHFRNLYYN